MSKKLNRRIDNKRVRHVERSVLKGGKNRTIRSWSGWGPKIDTLIPEVAPYRKAKKRKRQKPKERCPVTGAHHQYLKDTEYVKQTYEGFSRIRGWHPKSYYYERKYKLCVMCGKEVTLKSRYLRPC